MLGNVGKLSADEIDEAAAISLEIRASAVAKLAENRLFSIIHQVIMEKKLRLQSVTLKKKHYVDPALVRDHLTALGFFDKVVDSSSLPLFEDTQSTLQLSRKIWNSICPNDTTRSKYTGAELFDAIVDVPHLKKQLRNLLAFQSVLSD